MTQILDHNDNFFKVDETYYAKTYEPRYENNQLYLYNTGSTEKIALGVLSQVEINGVIYTDHELAIDELIKFVFKKGGGNGMGLQGSNTLYFDDATYVYISGLRANGDWYVNRNTIADNTQTTATETNNGGQTTQPLTLVICQGLSYS